PGQLNYASTGSGGIPHLAWELLNNMVGIKMQHIPYKGSGQALSDLIGGQVLMFINNPLTLIPHIKSGRLRAIAVSGESRLTSLPQVPTFAEAGLPGFDVGFWYGILAPASTPKPIIDKLSREIARILATPDFREKLLSQGVDPFISTPEHFAALLKADMVKWGKVIKIANIKIEK
ncbi:MAG: tripartite tricarboxylate transporter substrate-binding protein, partial [Pseudomonadota bacterium]